MRSLSSFLFLIVVSFVSVAVSSLTGCANARTEALERRQNLMNNYTSERAERRAIRSENADARNQALFDAM